VNVRQRSAGLVLVLVLVALPACVPWRSPERAKANPYEVWISILKGFSGKVYYLGSKDSYDYFQIGDLFPAYYKSPSCNFNLPSTFALGSEKPYVVTLGNAHGYWDDPTCGKNRNTMVPAPSNRWRAP
jgi:hypothetical protein